MLHGRDQARELVHMRLKMILVTPACSSLPASPFLALPCPQAAAVLLNVRTRSKGKTVQAKLELVSAFREAFQVSPPALSSLWESRPDSFRHVSLKGLAQPGCDVPKPQAKWLLNPNSYGKIYMHFKKRLLLSGIKRSTGTIRVASRMNVDHYVKRYNRVQGKKPTVVHD